MSALVLPLPLPVQLQKRCARCGEMKPADQFGISAKSGLQSYCKPCNSAQSHEKYIKKYGDSRRRRRRIDTENRQRQCTKCGEWKPWEMFSWNGDKPYPHSRCLECQGKLVKSRNDSMPNDKRKAKSRRSLLRRYGLTLDDYEALLLKQNGRCKICGTPTSGRVSGVFLVDHNHSTGEVRGLLCSRCNVGMGNFDEDVTRLRRVIRYIKSNGEV